MLQETRRESDPIQSLLEETRQFAPSQQFVDRARIHTEDIYALAAKDPDGFWASRAQELDWIRPFTRVLDWQPPFARWFPDGVLNASVNCVDRHVDGGLANKAAILWEGEPGDRRVLTYWDLFRDVQRAANALRRLGVQKGDRVAIYLPMIPEAVIAMLACARIGAIHSVVFAGFSPEALRDRINDCQARVLITADGGFRRGQMIPLKHDADYAIRDCPSIEHVVIVKRGDFPLRVKEGRDHWWHRLLDDASPRAVPEPMGSTDPLFILYTSGTTGKPKGVVHGTGGYLTGVQATTRMVFDLELSDVFWCTADIGWVTGHSYVVYGPLACGATVVMYEGAPDWPDRDRFWELAERDGVSVFYTAPTAIRAFMKWGPEHVTQHDLSRLRLLGTVGEPINPEAWVWYYNHVGHGRCPIVDTWWQTETGMILISPLPGLTVARPGSATRPLPGVDAAVVDAKGREVQKGGGYLVLRRPWPAMLQGIYNDPERYVQQYWTQFPGMYFTGDGARLDEDGYFWLLGRVDDVLNVAGHRLGTMEVESALVDHPAVAEAAVVGMAHDVKGQAIAAFVVLKEDTRLEESLESELKEHVVRKIGALARPDHVVICHDLPKTRSGKIMRRLLRDVAEGRALGDVTTLADETVMAALSAKYEPLEP